LRRDRPLRAAAGSDSDKSQAGREQGASPAIKIQKPPWKPGGFFVEMVWL
jgi:hypothetical protein